MAIGFIRALRLLHETFHHYPAGQRAHILGRFLSAPFLRTLDVIPKGSRVLDIGSGHGTYARLLVEERAREVVALDPDLRKALAGFRHPRVRWVAGFDDCIRGGFDAVVMYDVIYRLSPAGRDALFPRVFEHLAPGGIFIIKDIDPTSRLKWKWNRMQEAVSDRFLGLTIGEGLYPESPDEIGARYARAGFTGFEWRRVDRGYPHAHALYLGRRP